MSQRIVNAVKRLKAELPKFTNSNCSVLIGKDQFFHPVVEKVVLAAKDDTIGAAKNKQQLGDLSRNGPKLRLKLCQKLSHPGVMEQLLNKNTC